MSFLRHREIYQVEGSWRGPNRGHVRALRLDESPVGYSLAGCSPAEPASASPTGGTLQQWRGALQLAIRRYLFTTLSRGLTLGAHPSLVLVTVSTVFLGKPLKRLMVHRGACGHLMRFKLNQTSSAG
jgi:hypothetical protein